MTKKKWGVFLLIVLLAGAVISSFVFYHKLGEKRQAVIQLKGDNANLAESLSAAKSKLAAGQEKAAELENNFNNCKAVLETKTEALEKSKAEWAELKKIIAKLNSDNQSLKTKLAGLESAADRMEAKHKRLVSALKKQTEITGKLESQLESKRAEHKLSLSRTAELESEIGDISGKNQILLNRLDSEAAEKKALQNRIYRLESQKVDLKNRLERALELEPRIKELEDSLAKAKQDAAMLVAESARQRQSNKRLEKNNASLRENCARLKTSLNKMVNDLMEKSEVIGTFSFELGSSRLKPKERKKVKTVVKRLNSLEPSSYICLLRGHSDHIKFLKNHEFLNLRLSINRGRTVRMATFKQGPAFPASRVLIIGLSDYDLAERKVEVVIVKKTDISERLAELAEKF